MPPVRLTEWQKLPPEGELAGRELSDAAARALARQLSQRGVLRVSELRAGLGIEASSWVGRVALGDLTVTIEPKIAPRTLLTLLRYAYGLRKLDLHDPVGYDTSGAMLQDLLVKHLHAEVRELVARGLLRRYVPRGDELAAPRGRILLSELAKRGGIIGPTLPCSHFPRSSDHLLNQVLFAGVRLGGRVARDASLRASMHRLASVNAEWARTLELNAWVLSRARASLNRLSVAYEPALRVIELLYACSSLSLDEGTGETKLPGFLFDMNRFFQALLARFLHEHLHGYRVIEERGLTEMMRYVPGLNPGNRRAPRPRPDYSITQDGKVLTLLDAKYKDLWSSSVPRDMLYQLSVYALSQPRGATAAILYPTASEAATESVIQLSEPLTGGARGYVAVRPVHVERLATVIEQEATAEGGAMARRLAFGRGAGVAEALVAAR